MPRLIRCALLAAGAIAATPASAAILYQETVAASGGTASFSRSWLSTAPGTIWIGIDNGRLSSAAAGIYADFYGMFWYEVFDESEAGSHPELYTENYFTEPTCANAIGSGYCATPFYNRNVLITRMTGSVFQVDWKGLPVFNNCIPFNGVYFEDCAFFGYEYGPGSYDLTANATQPVTFTIYDTNPTNGAIPEPASWALLIAGFGLTGAVLRRRRQTASRA